MGYKERLQNITAMNVYCRKSTDVSKEINLVIPLFAFEILLVLILLNFMSVSLNIYIIED